MKKRLKHWITSILGIILVVFTCVMIYLGTFTAIQSIPMFLLGYTFLMAKDSVLEGITLGMLKIKK
jgi:cytochrome b subunit of formate dehydrogenase